MGAYRHHPNHIYDYNFDFEQLKHNIELFNNNLARKDVDEKEEEKAVEKRLEEES